MTRERLALGASGEAAVARWYEANGWTVLDRNWTAPGGELDLVVQRGALLVFCEVKTRSSLTWGSPAEAVNLDKQRRLRRLAGAWLAAAPALRRRHRHREIRFDVATVVGDAVEIIEGAF